MTPERYQQIDRLVDATLAVDPAARTAFLERECKGDEELLFTVQKLVAFQESEDGWLSIPPLQMLGMDPNDQNEQNDQYEPGLLRFLAENDATAGQAGTRCGERTVAPGEILAERYRIIEFLDRGGGGEVYEAHDEELNIRIALKVVHPLAFDKNTIHRFHREVQLARQVTHPNVCRVFDIGHDWRHGREIVFLTMELIRGETLAARCRRIGPWPQFEAIALAIQLCQGLGAAHDAGILHRDFKPGNVLLVDSPEKVRATITDFGIARAIHAAGDSSDPITAQGAVFGTPMYMSPEQLTGQPLTVATDIYSLGLVLYEMITGAKPFGEPVWMSVLKRLKERPPAPSQLIPSLDPRWNHTILRCLERDPAKRFGATSEIIESLLGGPLLSHRGHSMRSPGEVRLLQPTIAADYWKAQSPFRSLQPFAAEDAWLFFGRDRETSELVARLAQAPVLIVAGNSGSGKSSLIRAGLVPALRRGRFRSGGTAVDSWRIAVFRPSGSPFEYLAETLPGQLAPELSLAKQAEFSADCRSRFPLGGDALPNAIVALIGSAGNRAERHRILLIADQFEEIFTLIPDQDTRDHYIDFLLAAGRMDGAAPVHLILSLRADFYANCLQHAQLSRCFHSNLYNVPRMGPEQLRESIEKRLDLAGMQAEAGLVDSVLEDIGAEPGNLALLEHALGQLWEECGGNGCTMTNHAYSNIGRLRGALGRHADQVYEAIAGDAKKRLVQRVFLELVHLGEGAQDTRRRVRKQDLLALAEPEEMGALLDDLASSRLLLIGSEGAETFVEVSHEAIIREWGVLRDWLAQHREALWIERRLLRAAEEWQSLNQDPGALLQGARLIQAEEWLAADESSSLLAREFVIRSLEARSEAQRKERANQERELALQQAAAAQARRSATRLRWFASALAGLLLIAVAIAWFARRQQSFAVSVALAAQSEQILTRDPGRALDLAIRSWQTVKTEEGRLAVAAAFPLPMFSLRGHEGPLWRAEFSADGRRIITASSDNTARIWNASEGQLLTTLLGHTGRVWNVAFSPDRQLVITGSDDHTARIWNSASGKLLATLQGHTGSVSHVEFSPDSQLALTTSRDGTARIWNTGNGYSAMVLRGHNGPIWGGTFSPDGRRVVTCGEDQTAHVWNTADGKSLAVLIHGDRLAGPVFSPDGQRIVTFSNDHLARIWDGNTYALMATLSGHTGDVVHAAFSPDGRRTATASLDGTVRVWETASGRLTAILPYRAEIWQVAFSPDGRYILGTSYDAGAVLWNSTSGQVVSLLRGSGASAFSPDGHRILTINTGTTTALIWNIQTAGRSLAIMQGHQDKVVDIGFSPDGQRIVTASLDTTARIWKLSDGRLTATLQGHMDQVVSAAFSRDGKRIVTASADHTAKVWNSADGALLFTLEGHNDRVAKAAFSPDDQAIVTASLDATARLWRAHDGHLLAVLQGHMGEVMHATFSPDSTKILTAGADHTARLWSSPEGRLLTVLQGHTDQVLYGGFSPDGREMVTTSADGTARLWSVPDGHSIAILEGHKAAVLRAAFSPDGQQIVTASADGTARLWNSADGRPLAILNHQSEGVIDAEFSADSKQVVTAGEDRTARVWMCPDGRLLTILTGHTSMVSKAKFSPDGQYVVTASHDHTARVWRLVTLKDIDEMLTER